MDGPPVPSGVAQRRQRQYVTDVRDHSAGPRVAIEQCLRDQKFHCEIGIGRLPNSPSVILHGCHAIVFVRKYF